MSRHAPFQVYDYKGAEVLDYPEPDRLLPNENHLWFNAEFLTACAETPPACADLGTYCNGWEL